jgi:hypothetical protein
MLAPLSVHTNMHERSHTVTITHKTVYNVSIDFKLRHVPEPVFFCAFLVQDSSTRIKWKSKCTMDKTEFEV